jgi:N-acetyl sugar amidotransferase
MQICARCLYTSRHPLHLTFDDEGVCSGCRVHEEKDTLDWPARGEALRRLLDSYRSRSQRSYDCIVPVSGARDAHFIVHTVKNVYGMNPLLVTYNKHYNTDVGIRNLANLRIKFDCDIMTLTVNPEIVKKITRGTLRRLGSIYWHCLAGQTVYPVTMAVKLKIPLIVWGAHQGVDQVGMFSHTHEVEMTRKYRKEHDLMGLEADDLVADFDGIREDDVRSYRYPDDAELERVGVRGIYLGNYIRWDSKHQHERMIELHGYESAPQTRTFDTYNDVDCFNYADVHDYTKLVKHGYGKVTDHATRELRFGRLTREEAQTLAARYTAVAPRFLRQFLEWMGMTESGFDLLMDLHRNPAFWRRDERWRWQFAPAGGEAARGPSAEQIAAARLPKREDCAFVLTASKRPDYADDRYILIGKGYPSAPTPATIR